MPSPTTTAASRVGPKATWTANSTETGHVNVGIATVLRDYQLNGGYTPGWFFGGALRSSNPPSPGCGTGSSPGWLVNVSPGNNVA